MSFAPQWNQRAIVLAVSLNAAGTDTAIQIPGPVGKWRATKLTLFDASVTLGTSVATLGLYTAVAGGGTVLVTPALLTTLTGATVCLDMTLLATTSYQTANPIYLRNVVAHGSAATVSAMLVYDWMG